MCVFYTLTTQHKTNHLHCCLADATCSVTRGAHMAPPPLKYRLVQYFSYALIAIFSSELNDSEINQFLIFPWGPPGTPLIPRFESQKIKLVLIEQVLNAHPHVMRTQRIKGMRTAQLILMQVLLFHITSSGRSSKGSHLFCMVSVNYFDVRLRAKWTYKIQIHQCDSSSRICKHGRCKKKNQEAGRKGISLI